VFTATGVDEHRLDAIAIKVPYLLTAVPHKDTIGKPDIGEVQFEFLAGIGHDDQLAVVFE